MCALCVVCMHKDEPKLAYFSQSNPTLKKLCNMLMHFSKEFFIDRLITRLCVTLDRMKSHINGLSLFFDFFKAKILRPYICTTQFLLPLLFRYFFIGIQLMWKRFSDTFFLFSDLLLIFSILGPFVLVSISVN